MVGYDTPIKVCCKPDDAVRKPCSILNYIWMFSYLKYIGLDWSTRLRDLLFTMSQNSVNIRSDFILQSRSSLI